MLKYEMEFDTETGVRYVTDTRASQFDVHVSAGGLLSPVAGSPLEVGGDPSSVAFDYGGTTGTFDGDALILQEAREYGLPDVPERSPMDDLR